MMWTAHVELDAVYATALVNDDWSSFDYYGLDADKYRERVFAILEKVSSGERWSVVDVDAPESGNREYREDITGLDVDGIATYTVLVG